MKRMLLMAIVLTCSVEAHAQEINGWHRDTPLRQQWRADHAACVAANTTKAKPPAPPTGDSSNLATPLGEAIGLAPYGGFGSALRSPLPGTDWDKVTACMNAKGWFR